MPTRLNSVILPDDIIKKMKDKLEETRIKKIETGFSLCKEIDKNVLKFGNECEGTECRITRPFQRCKGTDWYEGLYHTHPIEEARPSTADLYGLYLDGLGCIGSAKNNNIKCFIRKTSEMDERILGVLEFEHYQMGLRAKEITDKEYEDRLKFLADKCFKKVDVI